MSVATRLSLVALAVAMVSLLITAVVGLNQGTKLAEDLIESRLVTVGASRGNLAERYFSNMTRQTSALALSPETARTIADLSDAYRELDAAAIDDEKRTELTEYYQNSIAPELEAVRGQPVGVADLLPKGAAAIFLQANYVAREDTEDPTLVDDAGGGSRWTDLHSEINPIYRDIASEAGFEDLYLIDSRSRVVVYSVGKGIDFATSLSLGPQSGSTLTVLVSSVINSATPDQPMIVDFAPYVGAGDRPAAFIASAVFDGTDITGVVAARINATELSSMMTNNGDWSGLGETGESYLVGNDDTMRSDSRAFIEDPASYVDAEGGQQGLSAATRNAIAVLGTTVLFQPITERSVDVARATEPGLMDTVSYRGTNVRTSYRALDIPGLNWVILTQIERSELDEPIVGYARNMLIAVAAFLVALTFAVVSWANRVIEPVRIVSNRLRAVRDGTTEAINESQLDISDSSPQEFVNLAADIDRMVERLDERQAEVTARSSERLALLRRFLPPTIVRRVEAGEQDVLDQSPHATVAVLVIHGLGELVSVASKQDIRNLLDRIVDEADGLARAHGLDRVKLSGDTYFAACGTSRPYLDHAPRSIAFVLEATELIDDIATEFGYQLAVAGGLDSGPVTIGLTGGTGLVYDAWGPTVTTASHLARIAGRDQILVSSTVRTQLPDSLEISDYEGVSSLPDLAIVTGSRTSSGEPL